MEYELFIRCKCGAEGVNITLDKDTGDIFFSMWHYKKDSLTLMNRLRWIWYIIKGTPYPDEVVIESGWFPLIIDTFKSMDVESRRLREQNQC